MAETEPNGERRRTLLKIACVYEHLAGATARYNAGQGCENPSSRKNSA
jgi:hypothetical protein